MNKLDHVVANNLKTTKDQLNKAINNEPKIDTNSFNLSRGTSDSLLVVTVSLKGGKKHISTTFAGPTCVWDSGATDIMVKINTINNMNRRCGLIK